MKITKKLDNEKKRIEKVLTTALLDDGEMIHALYEYDLAEHIDEWYDGLLADKDQLARNVAEKLIVYATGADIQFADRETIEQLVAQSRTKNYGFRSLVHAIVKSRAFLNK